jgi:2-oxoglutarate ferredoxin oxidoreductase subunit gamma
MELTMTDIRFSGFGGQGIIRCALIAGKALNIYGGKFATMNQAIGPEARGGACSSQLVVSDERVLYPYIQQPDILVAMSQEAYHKYYGELKKGGTLIIDEDLVKPKELPKGATFFMVPSTRFAEELGNRIFANLVMMGFFTAVTGITTAEVMKKALPGLVPDRFLEKNFTAFDKGYDYGVEVMKKAGAKKGPAAPKTAKKTAKKAAAKAGGRKKKA